MFVTFIALILTSNIVIYAEHPTGSIVNKIQIILSSFMMLIQVTLTVVYQRASLRNKVFINKYKFYWHFTVIILTCHVS